MEKSYFKTELQGDMLQHHPNNPRKNLGDLTELKKSIAKNGILQNLTVIPVDAEGDDVDIDKAVCYYVLIGNRRFEAGKDIVKSFPVTVIEGLSQREQLSIMLEENMQRSDLTIIEQAEGFQMMLDLGESVQDIVEKTGFSETTVYHRLNIAKLDKKTLEKKYNDSEFQLSLTDLYELERLKNKKDRNKILKEARNSREIKRLVDTALTNQKREENCKLVISRLEDRGVDKMPDKLAKEYYYSDEWDNLRSYNLDQIKDSVKTKGIPASTKDRPVYYKVCGQYAGIPFRIEVYRKKDKEDLKPSKWEIENQKRKKKEKILEDKKKEIDAELRLCITKILRKSLQSEKGNIENCEKLWDVIIDEWRSISKTELIYSWSTKTWQNMNEEDRRPFQELWEQAQPCLLDQMMISIINAAMNASLLDYSGIIRNTAKKCYISTFEFLEDLYEYHIPDEYKDFMNGKGAAWKEAENVMQEMKDE